QHCRGAAPLRARHPSRADRRAAPRGAALLGLLRGAAPPRAGRPRTPAERGHGGGAQADLRPRSERGAARAELFRGIAGEAIGGTEVPGYMARPRGGLVREHNADPGTDDTWFSDEQLSRLEPAAAA